LEIERGTVCFSQLWNDIHVARIEFAYSIVYLNLQQGGNFKDSYWNTTTYLKKGLVDDKTGVGGMGSMAKE